MTLLDRLRYSLLLVFAMAVGGGGAPHVASAGTILVTTAAPAPYGFVGEWSTTGTLVNNSLITGLSTPLGIAASGGAVFVANNGNNTVGKYTSSGQVVDASFISGLNYPTQLLAAGDYLYVMNSDMNSSNNKIGKYDTATGVAVNSSFITLTNSIPIAMALSGTTLYVLAESGRPGTHGANSFVVSYSATDGTFVADIIPTLTSFPTPPQGLAISGSSLYLSYIINGGYVSEYTTAGSLLQEKLIDNLDGPKQLAVSGSSLYVLQGSGQRLGEYSLSGSTINASLLTGLSTVSQGFVVVVPEPSADGLALIGLAGGGYSLWWRRRRA